MNIVESCYTLYDGPNCIRNHHAEFDSNRVNSNLPKLTILYGLRPVQTVEKLHIIKEIHTLLLCEGIFCAYLSELP